jgi:hypothetical protein
VTGARAAAAPVVNSDCVQLGDWAPAMDHVNASEPKEIAKMVLGHIVRDQLVAAYSARRSVVADGSRDFRRMSPAEPTGLIRSYDLVVTPNSGSSCLQEVQLDLVE